MEAYGQPILIIDDDRRTRDVVAHLVRLWGRHALEASNVAAGVALLDAGPACIILDLGLPDGSGEAVLRAVREQNLACRVVVCSGEADPNLVERLKALGADLVLTKPVAADDLENACLGRDRAP